MTIALPLISAVALATSVGLLAYRYMQTLVQWSIKLGALLRAKKQVATLVGALILVGVWWAVSEEVRASHWISGSLLIAVGWYWPALFKKRLVALGQKRLMKTMPFFIDLLRLQVQAGLNLESSLRVIAPYVKGGWGSELTGLIFLIDRGVALPAALKTLARRLNLAAFDQLVLAISQAQLLGASLTDTLAIQAETLRARRRQRAEEQARLAAVKIALPLVFCIFPALLIIYLAPAVLRIVTLF